MATGTKVTNRAGLSDEGQWTANDELGTEQVLAVDRGCPPELVEQQPCGVLAHGDDRLAHRRQWRVGVGHQGGVVEADHGPLGRHGKTVLASAEDRAQRQQVARRDDGRGTALDHRRRGGRPPSTEKTVSTTSAVSTSMPAEARARPGHRRRLALVVDTVFSVEGGRAAVAPLIERGATAVVAASDLMALGTILGAREHGLAVPADWSVVGFDDTALMAYTDPPLTTVRQPILAMCDHATRLLLDQLGGATPGQRRVPVPSRARRSRLHCPSSLSPAGFVTLVPVATQRSRRGWGLGVRESIHE